MTSGEYIVVEAPHWVGDRSTYLAIRAVAGVQEAAEAVVAVASRGAGGEGEGSPAIVALVRVRHGRGGTRGLDDSTLLSSVAIHGDGNVLAPVGGRGGFVAGGLILSKDTEGGDGGEEEPLESNHVGDGVIVFMGIRPRSVL